MSFLKNHSKVSSSCILYSNTRYFMEKLTLKKHNQIECCTFYSDIDCITPLFSVYNVFTRYKIT